jgi:hypothetical protein
LVLLLETGWVDTRINENLNVERAREVTALVPNGCRSKDDQILDRSPDGLHAGQLNEIHGIIRESAKAVQCSAMALRRKILRHNDSGMPAGREEAATA